MMSWIAYAWSVGYVILYKQMFYFKTNLSFWDFTLFSNYKSKKTEIKKEKKRILYFFFFSNNLD